MASTNNNNSGGWGNYTNEDENNQNNNTSTSNPSSLQSSPLKPPSVVSIRNESIANSPSYRPKSPSILMSPARVRRHSRSWSKNALLPGQSKYAIKNQAFHHFAAIDKIFNVEALIEDLKEMYGSEDTKQSRYAGFLFHAISTLRFTKRTVSGIRMVMMALQTELEEQELQKMHYGDALGVNANNMNKSSLDTEAIVSGEIVLLCLACVTELEIVFNATVSIADEICRCLRYWKNLNSQTWRFSILRIPERMFNPELHKTSCQERVQYLEKILEKQLHILGVTKRLMINMKERCPEGYDFKQQYGSLMGWAAEGFEVLQREIGGSTVTNESLVDLLKRSSRAFLRNVSIGSNLNVMSGIPEEEDYGEDNNNTSNDDETHALRSLGFSSPVSRDGGPRVMGVEFAEVLMVNLGELISSVPKFQQVQRKSYNHLMKPNWFLRRWPEWTILFGGIAAGLYTANQNGVDRDTVREYWGKFKVSAEEFVSEHVTDPLRTLFREIFFDDYGDVTDPAEIEAAKHSLVSALKDYRITRALADQQGYLGSLKSYVTTDDPNKILSKDTLARIQYDSDNMIMKDIVANFELQMQDPKKNMITGDVVDLMLIQALFLKKEMMVAMGKVDRLLKANQFNLETMALVPAFMVGAGLYKLSFEIYRRLGSEELRWNTKFELRMTLRDIEQCLNKVAHNSRYDKHGFELFRMDNETLGLLALLLHRFDELVHVHFYLNQTDAEERVRIEEDLEELLDEDLGVQQRVHVVHRMCRYFPDVFSLKGNLFT